VDGSTNYREFLNSNSNRSFRNSRFEEQEIQEERREDGQIITYSESEIETNSLQEFYLDGNSTEPKIQVDVNIAKKLESYQKEGVQFMWDKCFESVEKIQLDKDNSQGT
jgi:hypothetical protein